MLGNFITGVTVLAPAGMLPELSRDLDVSVRSAGLLITFGAAVLCVASPVSAWLTSRFDRRSLLAFTLYFITVGQLFSAFAPDYFALLVTRLAMLAVAALFTPQAAGTASLIAPLEKRGGTVAYVFLGWSVAAAIGLPVITYISSHLGWRFAHGGMALAAFVSCLLVAWRLPGGLLGAPVKLSTWGELSGNPLVLTLLLITTCQMAGQFVIFTFIGPLLTRLLDASPTTISLIFMLWGIAGFVGNFVATQIVDKWGAWRTSLFFTLSLLVGVAGWAAGSGVLPAVLAAVVFWGFGFAAANSMQQVRLVAAAPAHAGASVSLNTSVLYVGQGLGSAIGGALFVRDAFAAIDLVAVAFIAATIILIMLTRPRVPA